jgi:hypothetical protein
MRAFTFIAALAALALAVYLYWEKRQRNCGCGGAGGLDELQDTVAGHGQVMTEQGAQLDAIESDMGDIKTAVGHLQYNVGIAPSPNFVVPGDSENQSESE